MMLLIVSIAHIQLHIHGFSLAVSLFGSSRSTETYLGGEELQFKSTKQFKSAYKEVKIEWLY